MDKTKEIFKGWIQLLRPVNLIIFVVAVVVGWILAHGWEAEYSYLKLGLALLIEILWAAGSYALNDSKDLVEDRRNRPDRPIVTGLVKSRSAKRFGLLTIFASVLLSIFLGWIGFVLLSVISMLVVFYIYRGKGLPIVGNLFVSVCAAASFLLGAHAGGDMSAAIMISLLAGPVHFGREIAKDIEDLPGDRRAGLMTLPVVTSPAFAWRFTGLILLITAMAVPIPFFTKDMGWIFLGIALPFVALPLAFWAGGALAFPKGINSSKFQRNLKIIMIPGMLAFVIGELFS